MTCIALKLIAGRIFDNFYRDEKKGPKPLGPTLAQFSTFLTRGRHYESKTD